MNISSFSQPSYQLVNNREKLFRSFKIRLSDDRVDKKNHFKKYFPRCATKISLTSYFP
jgi:hypothetical protein